MVLIRRMVLFLLLPLATLFGADHDTGMWNEFGVRRQLPATWYLMSNVQLRFRDSFNDFYWFRWEGAAGFKPVKWLDLRVTYRANPTEKNDEWNNQNYILIDPQVQLYSKSGWTADFRLRLHQKLDAGRSYLRLRPRLTRSFKAAGVPAGWYVYDDVRFETTALKGQRDRLNCNWAATGFTFRLWGAVDLDLGYLVESSQATSGKWGHLHVLSTSIIRRF